MRHYEMIREKKKSEKSFFHRCLADQLVFIREDLISHEAWSMRGLCHQRARHAQRRLPRM
jgi:hypothetical protein